MSVRYALLCKQGYTKNISLIEKHVKRRTCRNNGQVLEQTRRSSGNVLHRSVRRPEIPSNLRMLAPEIAQFDVKDLGFRHSRPLTGTVCFEPDNWSVRRHFRKRPEGQVRRNTDRTRSHSSDGRHRNLPEEALKVDHGGPSRFETEFSAKPQFGQVFPVPHSLVEDVFVHFDAACLPLGSFGHQNGHTFSHGSKFSNKPFPRCAQRHHLSHPLLLRLRKENVSQSNPRVAEPLEAVFGPEVQHAEETGGFDASQRRTALCGDDGVHHFAVLVPDHSSLFRDILLA